MTRGELESFCRSELGSAPQEEEFMANGVGTVFGLRLRDGRRVVVKLYRAGTDPARVDAALTVQLHLAERGFPCPLPLTGPVETPAGLAAAETLLDRGAPEDPHERGTEFTIDQLRAVRAALVDEMTYTARCEHSDALTDFSRRLPAVPRNEAPEGSARAFLRAHGRELLDG
jgi:hypothetical protein